MESVGLARSLKPFVAYSTQVHTVLYNCSWNPFGQRKAPAPLHLYYTRSGCREKLSRGALVDTKDQTTAELESLAGIPSLPERLIGLEAFGDRCHGNRLLASWCSVDLPQKTLDPLIFGVGEVWLLSISTCRYTLRQCYLWETKLERQPQSDFSMRLRVYLYLE